MLLHSCRTPVSAAIQWRTRERELYCRRSRSYVAAELRASRRQSGCVRGSRGPSDPRAVLHAGREAQAHMDRRDERARCRRHHCARGLQDARADGARIHALRGRIRYLPHRLDLFQLDPALPRRRRHREVRNHQGLRRQPHERPSAPGDVHRLLVRRVHRRRGRFRRASRGGRSDAGGPRFFPFLCSRHLSAGKHDACCVWIHRHTSDDPGQRDRPSGPGVERDGWPALLHGFGT